MRGLLDWVSTCVPLSCAATLPLVRTFEVGDFLRGSTRPCATRHLSAVGMLSPSSPPIPDSIGFRRDWFPRRTAPVESPPVIGRLWSDFHRSPVTEASTTLASIPTTEEWPEIRNAAPRLPTTARFWGQNPKKRFLPPTSNKRSFRVESVLSLALFLHAAFWVQPASRTGSPLSMKTVILKVCRQLSRVAAAS